MIPSASEAAKVQSQGFDQGLGNFCEKSQQPIHQKFRIAQELETHMLQKTLHSVVPTQTLPCRKPAL
jgi:hypothetical protein